MTVRTASLIGVLIALALLPAAGAPALSEAAGSLEAVVACVDPGHGGADPGAVNEAFNLRESDINLDISFGVKQVLEELGATVVLTRIDDSERTNSDRYTFCNEAGATILVSIHTNGVTDPTWDGTLTLFAPNRAPDLAQALHDSLYPALRDTAPEGVAAFTDFGLDNFASGVLFKCTMPAAMVEPLLMSHPAEAALLVQPIYDLTNGSVSDACAGFSCRRGQIVQAVANGVQSYFSGVELPLMHVSDVAFWYERKGATVFLYATVAVVDDAGLPVSDATVALTVAQPDGTLVLASGTTGTDGLAGVRVRATLSGVYEMSVTSVSRANWAYSPGDNQEDGASLIVP